MIIEITPGASDDTWNLVAKSKADAWPPMYMAYERTVDQIEFLIGGILGDLRAAARGDAVAREVVTGDLALIPREDA